MGLAIMFMVIGTALMLFGCAVVAFNWWVVTAYSEKAELNAVRNLGAVMLAVGALCFATGFFSRPARAADLALPRYITLPPEITHGHSWGSIGRFGSYSDAWLERRWTAMCATAARYQAMSEAYDLGKANPCSKEQ